jgi:3-hydroxyacyl-[acyl-carrier-protein] dehydratase
MLNRRQPLVDFTKFDTNQVIADKSEVEAVNPHRYEMQLIDGILYKNTEDWTCVGFKDVTENEFWVRGHLPGMPIMPGVIMCETAAQVSSYFCIQCNMLETNVVGLGGLDDVRIRAPVQPGDKFIVMVQRQKLRPRILVNSYFQGWVNEKLCVDGLIKGVRMG